MPFLARLGSGQVRRGRPARGRVGLAAATAVAGRGGRPGGVPDARLDAEPRRRGRRLQLIAARPVQPPLQEVGEHRRACDAQRHLPPARKHEAALGVALAPVALLGRRRRQAPCGPRGPPPRGRHPRRRAAGARTDALYPPLGPRSARAGSHLALPCRRGVPRLPPHRAAPPPPADAVAGNRIWDHIFVF